MLMEPSILLESAQSRLKVGLKSNVAKRNYLSYCVNNNFVPNLGVDVERFDFATVIFMARFTTLSCRGGTLGLCYGGLFARVKFKASSSTIFVPLLRVA